MPEIIECVPNFSDGRRPEVYNAIADAVRNVPGTKVLNVSADPDHNRTVVTFVGDARAVEEGAFQAISRAAELIDLNQHEGEHPRIGAADVVPFIPVREATMDDCVELAHRLAKRVGDELGIAVYMYGRAATRPERKKLSNIRKGEFEGWKEEVGKEPEREPDYGPAEPKKWGATVIGARPFLIAYNIYLNSSNVQVANQIARAVRASSGGLKNVQALGFQVEGQAQVSMNLLNFEHTPVYRVQELVRREAARHGLSITHAELIGLSPQKAFMEVAKWYLQLDGMEDDQILEYRMAAVEEDAEALSEVIPRGFLNAVAGATPTPGGGSVAALAGALGAALTQMVAGITVGRKKYADVEDEAATILKKSEGLQAQLVDAIAQDAAAFDRLLAAYRKNDVPDKEREAAIQEATVGTGEVPLKVGRLSREVARLARQIAAIGNRNAATDAAAAGIMARASAQIAALNVRVNATGLKDEEQARSWRREVDSLQEDIAVVVDELLQTAAERGGY